MSGGISASSSLLGQPISSAHASQQLPSGSTLMGGPQQVLASRPSRPSSFGFYALGNRADPANDSPSGMVGSQAIQSTGHRDNLTTMAYNPPHTGQLPISQRVGNLAELLSTTPATSMQLMSNPGGKRGKGKAQSVLEKFLIRWVVYEFEYTSPDACREGTKTWLKHREASKYTPPPFLYYITANIYSRVRSLLPKPRYFLH
jgi:hypothetical protein